MKTRGFTLIELMVVLAIIGVVISLVAPLGLRQVHKAQAQQEWLTLQALVRETSFKSFANGRPLTVYFDGARASVGTAAKPATLSFRYLFFKPAAVEFNVNGYPDASGIELAYLGQPRTLDLWRVLGVTAGLDSQ